MDQQLVDIRNSLCKGLRASGLQKKDTHELVNTVVTWYQSNGAEWTVSRLKEYKQWYETYLAGNPIVPSWHSHTKEGLPKGIFRKVFEMRNQQKALAILSMSSVFQSEKITSKQRTKFLEALSAGQLEKQPEFSQIPTCKRQRIPDLAERLSAPPFGVLTGKSIPVHPEDGKLYPKNKEDFVLAYVDSWRSIPGPTLTYLVRSGRAELIPPSLLGDGEWDERFNTFHYGFDPICHSYAGHIGCIQQPELKARWIANPNRITQWFLKPLGDHWYDLLRALPTDCTFNQESGVEWVQDQLRKGITLAGADLTSATDLLDRSSCIELLCRAYLGRSFSNEGDWSLPVEKSYKHAIEHFMAISSLKWVYPEGGDVSWSRGQPLGTYPSFALLGLTNNALGHEACRRAGIALDSFRVIGDDFICDARALPHYVELVREFGGLINHSKTLTSDRCAEFAGRVITADRSMNKTVKYKDMSDNSFMSIMSQLGDQAKHLLKPRQRAMYDKFKFVPGVAVDGPYSKDSFSVPLVLRYTWYLMTGLADERVVPDLEQYDAWQFATQIYYVLSENGRLADFEYCVPYSISEEFHSSLAQAVVKNHDPRLKDGLTCLQALERTASAETFESFTAWIVHEVMSGNRSVDTIAEWMTKTPESTVLRLFSEDELERICDSLENIYYESSEEQPKWSLEKIQSLSPRSEREIGVRHAHDYEGHTL